MNFLNKLLSLGGLFPRGKTLVGGQALAVYLLLTYFPQYTSLIMSTLAALGITLTPIGIANKVVKNSIDKEGQ